MPSISRILVLFGVAVVSLADSWGPAFSLGPTSPNSAVIESFTTFIPGKPPTNPQDALFLWPGTSNATSGLIQSGADQLRDQKAYCGANATSWCVSASYFGVGGQKSGPLVPVDGNTPIDIHYKLASDQRTWDQTVTVNGKVISTLQSFDGPLIQGGWGTGTECQSNCRGTISTQTYKNTKIILSRADPDFKNTLGVGGGVQHTGLTTPDGGKTWTVTQITIPPYTAP
ncbi:hypothetical protein E1B28_007717 [Marasmius oreades]|uniref:Lectin n=1 Tax=Marasmius oreades TaxID=181124 RepID=A0A9P7UUB2_9AGAR|nr:uncharacterized protein E1B28_007717 [Marasmius oreades]KAG7094100.1 hypothetical protein E1B28_007717 [Marasmius oreades]